jgi:hypothetical protein
VDTRSPPAHVVTHLRRTHEGHPTASTSSLRQAALDQMLLRPWFDPRKEPCPVPPTDGPPIPGLTVFQGLGCPGCPYVARKVSAMASHYSKTHVSPGACQKGRRPRGCSPPQWRRVSCQRFFCSNIGSSFFAVNPPADNLTGGRPRPIHLVSESEFTRAHVLQDLQHRQAIVQHARDTIPTRQSATEVCPWLDLTQWPRYVQGP